MSQNCVSAADGRKTTTSGGSWGKSMELNFLGKNLILLFVRGEWFHCHHWVFPDIFYYLKIPVNYLLCSHLCYVHTGHVTRILEYTNTDIIERGSMVCTLAAFSLLICTKLCRNCLRNSKNFTITLFPLNYTCEYTPNQLTWYVIQIHSDWCDKHFDLQQIHSHFCPGTRAHHHRPSCCSMGHLLVAYPAGWILRPYCSHVF